MCLHLALASAHDCGAHGGRFVCPAARSEVGMTTRQVVFSQDELLADHPIAAPLTAHGRRCHGGFDEDGTYVSPRTRFRWPAIEAWEEQRLEQFGTPILDVPLETWPENFPNVAQTKFLLANGVREPTIVALTRIGTVEGFGGILRQLPLPEFERCFVEDVTGTAVAHIGRGLFEAHARDEAGHGDQAGHNEMWFAARDIAFEDPVSEDQTARMLARMGLGGSASAPVRTAPSQPVQRTLPEDVDPVLEVLVGRMIGLLLIEISAFHGFAWAEAVLADDRLVAGDGDAADLVAHIRADESPHVAWLRTALSEMRDRTWKGDGGRTHDGNHMIERLWDQALGDSLLLRRRDNLAFVLSEIELATAGRQDGTDLVAEMMSMGSVVRGADGTLRDADGDHLLG